MSRQLIVTGVGYKELDPTSHGDDIFACPHAKPNMGACVALHAAKSGYQVNAVARTVEKLEKVRESILRRVPSAIVHCRPCDALDPESVRRLAMDVPGHPELDI